MSRRLAKKSGIPKQKGIVRKKNGKIAWGAGRKLNNARRAKIANDKAQKGVKNIKIKKKATKKGRKKK